MISSMQDLKPSKIICAGLNYRSHASELGMQVPKDPVIFLKPPSSIIYDKEKIILPKASGRVDFEAELAMIIGRRCKNVSQKDALSCVEGYTCLNDVTARDLQKKDGQWTRAKSFDTFCPIGPKVVPPKDIDPNSLRIRCMVNGITRQDSSTSEFIFTVEYLISFVSGIMTLEKGDIISTGTPPGIGPLKRGDTVEVRIESIGALINFVSEEK